MGSSLDLFMFTVGAAYFVAGSYSVDSFDHFYWTAENLSESRLVGNEMDL